MMVEVLVISGSKSDDKIIKKATDTLDDIGISFEVEIASAHREPERVKEIVSKTEAKVIIAIAGLAAALPGVVASYTKKPVIGVPVSAALNGLDALLSIVQMPKGVPVATVGIDNGQNAAHLAARILGVESETSAPPSTYAEAGVNEDLVSDGLKVLGKYVKESFLQGEVTQEYGHYANTVKISDDLCIGLSTDGVGSKVLIAELAGKYDTIGIDCVAMNVNDLICIGVIPVGFVDYLASEKPLPTPILDEIGKGLLEGCKQSGIPILGGETAILPDMIKGAKGPGLDLAGTAVGIANPNELIDGSRIQKGDAIVGIASNGIHSNGFTLARKVVLSKYSLEDKLPDGLTVAEELLRPTKIYVAHFKALVDAKIDVRGIAHITGSGFKKILRLGPFKYTIEEVPQPPSIFEVIRETGNVEWSEMFTTFNNGVGLVIVVPQDEKERALKVLGELDTTFELGKVEDADKPQVEIVQYGVTIR
ncbi:MAG: phosphoribosylformylglycinamidine cyclo-ligase [Candidatus Thorarchaeota archaeon]|jgi:phosphoribosylformylglycinamidine cyclo-ligase